MKKTLLSKLKVMVCASFAVLSANVLSTQAVAASRFHNSLVVKQQESGTISGKIVDEKGEPLPGATITIKGLNQSVMSGLDGSFNIKAPVGTYDITVTYVSYATVNLNKVAVKAGENTPLNITLKGETGTLNEVIVVGYGTQKELMLQVLLIRSHQKIWKTDQSPTLHKVCKVKFQT
ncbi:carboxypeptidase regulatory-like domain-containing protein [Mucilaginibacter humi]|uniref:carboxypeptidase regulatory-like domain-containing protein n=1 Tax=Mucilaginibacter humi TaxID=2732510 RepID=UPI001FE2870E|nr:carboxypeptidase regulatory-like domain-containing protein [Mucilaginibacter humi]